MIVFNSLTKRLEEFKPLEDNVVVMYICGLTPYDSAHIGHARNFVSFDVIKRYLIKKGYKIKHIQNITDVEDKIIKRCLETGADPMELTTQVHEEAMGLFDQLNILRADSYPKVTENIDAIIEIVSSLIEKGFAYETESGVYFDVSKFQDYGKLSGQDIEHMKAGVRKEVVESKRSPLDFALWKKTIGEILEFDSPWGKGRPGWHIECSAMSRRYGRTTLDIHGGARDLIFPHHENEIAQSEAANGQLFCKYWVHTGFLTVEGEKMSKSLGNFITLKQALSKSSPNALRLFYLQAHYRSPLDYDEYKLASMEESVERIFNSLGLIRELGEKGDSKPDEEFGKKTDELISSFYNHMDDDFKTPEALASVFSLLRLANSNLSAQKPDREQLAKIHREVTDMLWILGLKEKQVGIQEKTKALIALLDELGVKEKPERPEKMLELFIRLREEARASKDFSKSDLIRSKLKEIGIILEDKADGTRWKLA